MNAAALRDAANALYSGDVDAQQEAADFYFAFMSDLAYFPVSLDVLREFDDLHSSWVSLHVVDYAITARWAELDKEGRSALRDVLFGLLEELGRPAIIHAAASRLLAKVGIREFPDEWPTFLDDCVMSQPCEVFADFVEILDFGCEWPTGHKNLLRRKILEHIELFSDLIFGSFPLAAAQFRLLNGLLKWVPIPLLINELNLRLLLNAGLGSDVTRREVRKCLTTLLVERLDASDLIREKWRTIIAALFPLAQSDEGCAVLLSQFLLAHMTEFKSVEDDVAFIVEPLQLLAMPGWSGGDSEEYFGFWSEILRAGLPIEAIFDCCLENTFTELADALNDDFVNINARACIAALCRAGEGRVIEFLQQKMAEPSPGLVLFLASALGALPDEPLIEMTLELMAQFEGSIECLIYLLPCAARFSVETSDTRFHPFVIDAVGRFLDSEEEAEIRSAVVALNLLCERDHDIFFVNSNALLDLAIDKVTRLLETGWSDHWAMVLFKIIAFVCLNIEQAVFRSETISRCLAGVIEYLQSLPDDLDNFVAGLRLLSEYCQHCFYTATVCGPDLFPLILAILSGDEADPIVDDVYELAAALTKSLVAWDDVEPFLRQILELQQSPARFGAVLNFYSEVRSKYVECEFYFTPIHDRFCRHLLDNVSQDTPFALQFMHKCCCWNLAVDFPIGLCGQIEKVSANGAKLLLKILLQYLMALDVERAAMIVREYLGRLLDFVCAVLTNSFYNEFFRLQVKVFGALVQAARAAGVRDPVFHKALIGALRKTLGQAGQVAAFARYVLGLKKAEEPPDYEDLFGAIRTLITSAHCCCSTVEAVFSPNRRVDSLAELLGIYADMGG
jgi:hypothetical protein